MDFRFCELRKEEAQIESRGLQLSPSDLGAVRVVVY